MSDSGPAFYEGQRFGFDKALCTVRYYGNLQGTQGKWLGVEWDDPGRGKHDGVYKNERIFRCKSSSKTAASFIRPSRIPDIERSVLEAIKFKYTKSQLSSSRNGTSVIEISGKVVEEVGFDRIQQQISVTEDLKIVLVDGLGVLGLTTRSSSNNDVQVAREELAVNCPHILELDLGWNPIETWQDVADACQSLKELKILKVSGSRIRDFDVHEAVLSKGPFKSILELQLNESLLRPEEIWCALHQKNQCLFPSLKRLWLSQNELTSLHNSHLGCISETVAEVYLENNFFTGLDVISDLFLSFPAIKTLSLQGNSISGLGTYNVLQKTLASHEGLETLNLAGNQITDFGVVDALPAIFPNLTSLRISKNPLYDNLSSSLEAHAEHGVATASNRLSDSGFFLTLARIPNLKSLNYTTITQRDREEGEIYYLSVAEKDIRSTISTKQPNSNIIKDNIDEAERLIRTRFPRYTDLCVKYDRESILSSFSKSPTTSNLTSTPGLFSSKSPHYAPGTLGSRLLNTTFCINSPFTESLQANKALASPRPPPSHQSQCSISDFTLPLPPNLKVYTLKSIVARHFSLPPLQFRLIYESEELDPVRDPIVSKSANWEDWGEWDVDGDNKSSEDTQGEIHDQSGAANPVYATYGTEGINPSVLIQAKGKWTDGYLMYEGQKFKKREVEILDGMRSWGDFVEDGVRDVRIKVEPFDKDWRNKPWKGWKDLKRGLRTSISDGHGI